MRENKMRSMPHRDSHPFIGIITPSPPFVHHHQSHHHVWSLHKLLKLNGRTQYFYRALKIQNSHTHSVPDRICQGLDFQLSARLSEGKR